MKKWVILCILDIAVIAMLISLIAWWENTHREPGLSSMMDVKIFYVYLFIAIMFFVLSILMIIRNKRS